ncbi:MAG: AAA family ATPase [Planctomycetaceae bacterium]|nr:AAA family ATPase [Planctomycetaceae bacterium]
MSCNFPDGPLGRVLSRLQSVTPKGDKWMALCPAHDDSKPSLSVSVLNDGSVLAHCFAGCTFEAVAAAIDLPPKEWFANPKSSRSDYPKPPGPISNKRVKLPPNTVHASAKTPAPVFPPEKMRALWIASHAEAAAGAIAPVHQPVLDFIAGRKLEPALKAGLLGLVPEAAAKQCDLESWFRSGHRLVAPLHDRAGEVVAIQARSVVNAKLKTLFPPGSKIKGTVFATPKALERFANDEHADGVVIVGEGLTDFLALGGLAEWPVVAMPGSEYVKSGVSEWAENATVLLAVDNDAAGEKAVLPTAQQAVLHGAARVLRVIWPEGCKDACDALAALGQEGLKDFLRNVLALDPSALSEAAVAKTSSYEIDLSQFPEGREVSIGGGVNAAPQSEPGSNAKPRRSRRFAVGDSVRATDHDNIGTILELREDSALVQFVNKREGGTDQVYLPLSALEHTRKRSSEIPGRLSVAALLDLPPPKLFVEGMLVRGSLIVIYGPSNCGKSFLALELAMCLASGRPFAGRKCEQARTNYIAGEGIGGIKKRLLAWGGDGIPRPTEAPWNHFELYPGPVSLLEETQVDKLIDDILSMPERPVALGVDTLARSFAGGDENTAEDMNEFVAACDLIREETGVAVVVIHHTGKAKKGDVATERGSSVLRAAADTMIEIEPTGELHTDPRIVRCAKQKDLEPFPEFAFVLDQVTTSIVPGELGETSCRVRYVPVPASNPESKGDKPNDSNDAGSHEKVIAICNALRDFGDSEGLPRGRLLKCSGLPESTFDRHLKTAIDSGLIVKRGAGQRSRYLSKEQDSISTPNTPKNTPMGVVGDPRTTTPNKPLSLERGVGGDGGVRAEPPEASTSVGVRATKRKPQAKRSKRGSKQ